MICPKKVQDMCLFGMMCPREAVVDDDGECADFINKALGALDGARTKKPDLAEVAEMQQERWAIAEETFEGCDWKKDNPTLRGMQTPEMPCKIPMPEKEGPALRLVMLKAPLRCRFLRWLRGASPTALFFGCRLGCRRVFCNDCCSCPEYRGIERRRKKCR